MMTELQKKIQKLKKEAKKKGLETTEGLILDKGKFKEVIRDGRN